MSETQAAKTSSRDPLATVANALDKALKAAKAGNADAKSVDGNALPAAGRFLSRLVYTTSYTFGYGVVLPAVMIARLIPESSSVAGGFVNGAAGRSREGRPVETSSNGTTRRSAATGRRQTFLVSSQIAPAEADNRKLNCTRVSAKEPFSRPCRHPDGFHGDMLTEEFK